METTNNYYIYVLLNTTKEGKYCFGEFKFDYEPFYLGVSNLNTYYVREDVHIKYAKIKKDVCNNKYKMNIINNIIKKGYEPKSIRVLENLNKDEAFNKEIELISLFGNKYDKSGPLVNISKGGDGGDTFTNNPRKEEIREKHRLNALGENNNMYGLPLEKRPSHIAKINGVHWNKGRIISEETRNLLKKNNKGKGNPRAKKTLLFDKDFNLVKEFDYCYAIADYIGSTNKAVSKTARTNSTKDMPYHTTKGYYIIYKDDWDNKFKNNENEIREYLKKFNKNKNQFL